MEGSDKHNSSNSGINAHYDLISKVNEFEKRILALEKVVFADTKKPKWKKSTYKGLKGGIQLLTDNGFFNKLRTAKETSEELKREGYPYPLASISKALSVDFTNRDKLLNRVKESNVWKYALRK